MDSRGRCRWQRETKEIFSYGDDEIRGKQMLEAGVGGKGRLKKSLVKVIKL